MAELGQMSSAEMSIWFALYKEEPWDEHMDLGFGQVCATIANYAGKSLKEGISVHASDFMPLPKPEEKVDEVDPLAFFENQAKLIGDR